MRLQVESLRSSFLSITLTDLSENMGFPLQQVQKSHIFHKVVIG